MLKILRALMLLLALCYPVLAGDLPCPPAPQPPPAPSNSVEESEGGEIHTPSTAQDSAIEVALTLLGSILTAL